MGIVVLTEAGRRLRRPRYLAPHEGEPSAAVLKSRIRFSNSLGARSIVLYEPYAARTYCLSTWMYMLAIASPATPCFS
jgi:hypothetical protein